jgi:ankyrin repeat protein
MSNKFNKLLYGAVKQNNIGAAEEALEKGASANYVYSMEEPPEKTRIPVLYLAVKNKNKELVDLLLARGADPNARFYESVMGEMEDIPCLIEAFSSIEILKTLLENGADPNVKYERKWDYFSEKTAFELAEGNDEAIDLLRQYANLQNEFESPVIDAPLMEWKCRCGCLNPADRAACLNCDRYHGID